MAVYKISCLVERKEEPDVHDMLKDAIEQEIKDLLQEDLELNILDLKVERMIQ